MNFIQFFDGMIGEEFMFFLLVFVYGFVLLTPVDDSGPPLCRGEKCIQNRWTLMAAGLLEY